MINFSLGYTKLLVDTAKEYGLLRNQLAYLLATAYWETAHTMKPVKEAFWLSEDWRKKNLRYYPWYGRGFVQLTWDYNYKKATEKTGTKMDTVSTADNAMIPEVAAKVIVQGMIEGWFTGKKLSDYITLTKSDYKGARRIINGTDKDDEIADIARQFEEDLIDIGYGIDQIVVDVPKDEPLPIDVPTTPVEVPKKSFIEVLVEILTKLFGGKNV